MRADVDMLLNCHSYARQHGAKAQQNKAFACLLWLALHQHRRLELEIHADEGGSWTEATKNALVGVYDRQTKRRIRAPLYKPMEVGNGTLRPISRLIIAAIALEGFTFVAKKKYGNGTYSSRPLSRNELDKLDSDIERAAGGPIPHIHENAPQLQVA